MKFNLLDEIIFHLFKGYTYKVYKAGFNDGYNWKSDLTTF